jgi:hypothetical protein
VVGAGAAGAGVVGAGAAGAAGVTPLEESFRT